MPVAARLQAAPTFAEGQTLSIFRRSSIVTSGPGTPQPGTIPPKTPLTTTTVDHEGFAEVSGLLGGVQYVAAGQIDGLWRYVGFLTNPEPTVIGVGGVAPAELAAEVTARATADTTEASARASSDATTAAALSSVSASLTAITTAVNALGFQGTKLTKRHGTLEVEALAFRWYVVGVDGDLVIQMTANREGEATVTIVQEGAGGHTVTVLDASGNPLERIGNIPVPPTTPGSRYFMRIRGQGEGRFLLTDAGTVEPLLPEGGTLTPSIVGTGSGPELRSNGVELRVRGNTYWMLPSAVTAAVSVGPDPFWLNQYNNRAAIFKKEREAGATVARIRIDSKEYVEAVRLSKPEYVAHVLAVVTAAEAQGLIPILVAWDPLDGKHTGESFAANMPEMRPMFLAIWEAVKSRERVIFNYANEPNSMSWAQLRAGYEAELTWFVSTLGYRRPIIFDGPGWANSGTSKVGYSKTDMETIQAKHAELLGSAHQIAWSKHAYANNSGYESGFTPSGETTAMGGAQTVFLWVHTEVGNYNGSPPVRTWDEAVLNYSLERVAAVTNYAGLIGFLHGPWSDANATSVAAVEPYTEWGQILATFMGQHLNEPPKTEEEVKKEEKGESGGFVGTLDTGAEAADITAVTLLKPKAVRFGLNKSYNEYAGGDYTAAKTACETFNGKGISVIHKLEFFGTMPTFAQIKPFLETVSAFPGVKFTELGNETSFGEQYGDGSSSPSYKARARAYATLAREASEWLKAHRPGVGLLVQADDGGSGNSVWVDEMFAAQPTLATYVNAWVLHCYRKHGGVAKMKRDREFLEKHGDKTTPIDITEGGFPSDNGATLDDGSKITYAEAGSIIAAEVAELEANSAGRLRHWTWYQVRDQRATGVDAKAEHYFGAVENNGSTEKGALSTGLKAQFAR